MLHGRRPRTHTYLLLIEAPGVVQRLPSNPGFQGDQGDPIYSHHAVGASFLLTGYGLIRGLFPGTSQGEVLCGLEHHCSPLWPRTPLPVCPAACVHPCAHPPRTSQSFSRPLLLQQSPAGYHRDGFVQGGPPHASLPAWSPIQYQQERCLQTAKEHHGIY